MFALELYRKLARTPGNLFCSPYSVGAALALLAGGAAGSTLAEIARALGVDDPVAVNERLVHELASRNDPKARSEPADDEEVDSRTASSGVLMSVANALWYQRGYAIVPAYVEAMASRLAASVQAVDFERDTAHTIELINEWAADATRRKITKVLSILPPATRVILANAIYMKARWRHQFSAYATQPKPFATPREQINVPTMARTGAYQYAKLSAMEAIEIPYAGGKLAMLVIVPQLGAIAEIERVVDVDRVASALTTRQVQLEMPKWKVESTFRLGETLGELGIAHAFSGDADFTPMSAERGFHVDEIVHKTYVDVDEKGTEAAAVTVMAMRGMAPRHDDVVKLQIDRPFLFAIRDLPTNTILFMGRVEDPR